MGAPKRKGTEGLRGKDSIPGVIKSWASNSTQEPLLVQLGHPAVHGQGTVTPRLCPQGF